MKRSNTLLPVRSLVPTLSVQHLDHSSRRKSAPLIARFYDSSKLRIDSSNSMNTAEQDPVFIPEVAEDLHKASQHRFRIRRGHYTPHALHAAFDSNLVEERFQQTRFAHKQVVDRLPRNAAGLCEAIQRQTSETICLQLLSQFRQDRRALLIRQL